MLLIPAVEEVIFRGVGIELSERRTGSIYPGLLFGAAGFAAIHIGHRSWDYVLLFCGGLLLGCLYIWRRNLTLPMIAHMMVNLLVLALAQP